MEKSSSDVFYGEKFVDEKLPVNQFASRMLISRATKRRGKKPLVITSEILPPGSLKRNNAGPLKTHSGRWEEIIDICAATIAEDMGSP